jgi:hypothetical protein
MEGPRYLRVTDPAGIAAATTVAGSAQDPFYSQVRQPATRWPRALGPLRSCNPLMAMTGVFLLTRPRREGVGGRSPEVVQSI